MKIGSMTDSSMKKMERNDMKEYKLYELDIHAKFKSKLGTVSSSV